MQEFNKNSNGRSSLLNTHINYSFVIHKVFHKHTLRYLIGYPIRITKNNTVFANIIIIRIQTVNIYKYTSITLPAKYNQNKIISKIKSTYFKSKIIII